jgi:hypothetical protein
MKHNIHNHPNVIAAIREAHDAMMYYAKAGKEYQSDAIRDTMRRIAELSKVFDTYRDG